MLFGIWSMASGVWTTTATVDGAVYRTECHVSANLSVSQTSWMATTKRREENRIQLYAAINLKRNLRSTYCTIEATDRHEASHSLSVTAEQLVQTVVRQKLLAARFWCQSHCQLIMNWNLQCFVNNSGKHSYMPHCEILCRAKQRRKW